MPDSVRTSDLNEIVPIPVTEPPYRIYPYNYSYLGDVTGPQVEKAVTNHNVVPARNYPRVRANTHMEVTKKDPWVDYTGSEVGGDPLDDGWEYDTQHFTLGKDKNGVVALKHNAQIPPDITVPVGEEILPLKQSVERGNLPPGSVQANKRFSPQQPHENSAAYTATIPGITYGLGEAGASVEEPSEIIIPNNNKIPIWIWLGVGAGAVYFFMRGK